MAICFITAVSRWRQMVRLWQPRWKGANIKGASLWIAWIGWRKDSLLGEDRRGDERVVTQAFTGCFRDSDQRRNEFLRAVSHSDLR